MANDCWSCGWQRKGGHNTFLGFCEYFPTVGRPAKEIPPEVVDRGCAHWKPRGRQPGADPENE